MTQDDSIIFEKIHREFQERAASDARLSALLGDLHGAFKIATETARGDARG